MTTSSLTERRPFSAGTTGWTATDLDDPRIEPLWERGNFEIIEGVLTRMPPAYYDSSSVLGRLINEVLPAIKKRDPRAVISSEVDVIVGERRVVKVDALYLSPQDREAQKRANAIHGSGTRKLLTYGRILVPPTLIIESLSRGHEDHDRVTKRQWFAEMKVPNYWLLNAFDRSLECLSLEATEYRIDAVGRGEEEVRPSLFPGLAIPLATLWED